jgi:hypothetical protein
MRYSKKYPNDMVENLAESPWTCSDGPGSAPNKIPKGVSFLEREQEREEKRRPWSGWRRERSACFIYIPRPETHPRVAPADSPRSPRGRSARCADGPAPRSGQSVIRSRTSSTAPLPSEPRGQSASPWRTVCQERTDSVAHRRGQSDLPFLFNLIYFEIKI